MHALRRLTAALALCLATAAVASVASAQDANVRWDPGWNRFGWWDVGLTAGYATEWMVAGLLGNDAASSRRVSVFPDEPLRSALRARRPRSRALADELSDVLVASMLAYPLLVDAVTVAWLVHDVEDTAWQMAAIDAQAMLLASAITYTLKTIAPRERPLGRGCRAREGYSPGCHDSDRHRSFPSGHTVLAATVAGLTCLHHEHLALYGGRAADAAACGTMIALATLVGGLRIVADKHYATDVLVGAVVGVVAGWLVPSALFYGFGDSRRATTSITGVTIETLTAPPTLSWGAAF